MKRVLAFEAFFLFVLLLSSFSSAATLFGTVFGEDFEPLPGAVVEVKSVSTGAVAGRSVARNGSYVLVFPAGNYSVNASFRANDGVFFFADEVSLVEEGQVKIDFVILSIELGKVEVNASELLENGLSEGDVEDLEAVSDKQVDLWLLGFLVVFSGAIVAFMVFRKPRKGQGVEEVKERVEKHLSREEKVLVGKIRAFGGRVAQRELRKHLDWSEAAVSMVLTKLEDKGVVRKIKKGRGNVLKLVEERNL